MSTKIVWPDPWAAAGVASMRDDDDTYTKIIPGGKVIATYRLAEEGDLSYEDDVCYDEIISATPSPPPDADDTGLVRKAQDATRAEMDCQTIKRIIETFWLEEANARKEALDAERVAQMREYPTPLAIEEQDRTFGMVIPKRRQYPGDTDFHELGTLLRIVNIQFYPDGRSLIETVGLSRFRVLEHNFLDGYMVGKTERVDDVSLEDEEAAEAAEASPMETESNQESIPILEGDKEPTGQASPLPRSTSSSPQMPTSVADVDTMSTQSLMQYASSFVIRMREQSVPWLTERMLTIYGECPEDPAIFPWWFASMLPVKDIEKYRLLGTSSVRERLKICCTWIVEWEMARC
ncbi:hypothetical protein ACLX1H_008336 [Fusarium chlamydosporum]